MNLIDLFKEPGTISVLLNLSIVSILGVILGKISIGKVKLGIAGVLFTGLLIGHIGAGYDQHVLHFIKEFGLILFVYSIGIEIGPRFISSFRKNGFKLNILAATIVILGFAIAVLLKYGFNIDVQVIAGIFSGAVTNTPSLGAIQSLISDQVPNGNMLSEVSGMAYAVAYPFGIIGIILVMILVRIIFKIIIKKEIESYQSQIESESSKSDVVEIKITNPNLFGKSIKFLKKTLDKEFVFSRLQRNGEFIIPDDKINIKEGDILFGLCQKNNFPQLELKIGKVAIAQKIKKTEQLSMRHILVTNRTITGKQIKDINFSELFPANITRIFRGDSEIIPSEGTTIEFGDTLRVVGARDKMNEVANFIGNSLKDLSHPNLVPLFIGILLGVLLGSIPFFIPGLPAPAKLGIAGGPLIIALILGHKGRIKKIDFYMTPSANRFIRELGIILFLACVGLGSGKHFAETIVNGGYVWMLYGAGITFFPLLIVGITARLLKINYLTICGLLAGSMTDPPALEFATSIAPLQVQANAYATVYPLTMFLRILLAQILVLLFL